MTEVVRGINEKKAWEWQVSILNYSVEEAEKIWTKMKLWHAKDGISTTNDIKKDKDEQYWVRFSKHLIAGKEIDDFEIPEIKFPRTEESRVTKRSLLVFIENNIPCCDKPEKLSEEIFNILMKKKRPNEDNFIKFLENNANME